MSNLQDLTALVTGSTGGVGVGIARRLAAAGAFVVVSGRDAARGGQVVRDITDAGGRASFVRVDLAGGEQAITTLADAALAATGRIDVLVNNAAMLLDPAPTGELTADLIERALAVNVAVPILLTGRLAPAMVERGRGVVVNVGSINGIVGMNRSVLYSVTKAAVHSMTRSLAMEFGPRGVRVNTVAPGPTATDHNRQRESLLAPILNRIPSGRMSTVDEIGDAVVFLASSEASNVHGATLTVDGGYTAG